MTIKKWISKEYKKSLIWRSNVTYIKLQNMQRKHVCWYELKWLGGTDVVVKLIPIFTKNKNPKLIRITISKNHCKIDMKICRKNKLSNQLIAIILFSFSLTKFCYLYPFQWLFIPWIPLYGRMKKLRIRLLPNISLTYTIIHAFLLIKARRY